MTLRMTPEDIADILREFGRSGFARLELTVGPTHVAVNRAPAATVESPSPERGGSGEGSPSARSKLAMRHATPSRGDLPLSGEGEERAVVEVRSPLAGIFQVGAASDTPALVRPGSEVEADTIVGFVRVMQEVKPVRAGRRGTVVEVAVQDGQFVEYGQTLLRLAPVEKTEESPCPI